MRSVASFSAVAAVFCLLVVAGCSGQKIKTVPVSGKVEIKDGDVALLTGSYLELKHDSEEALRPGGNIDASGKFIVKTVHEGKVLQGAPEGKYKARIVLGDPSDDGVPKRKGNPIHNRYLAFETSGLSYTIPPVELTVSLSKK